MRRPENGFRELSSFLHHAGSLACYLVDVADEFPDHALREESRLRLASVEWPGSVSAVHGGCGQIVPQDPRWQTPCCGPSPL